MDELKYRLVRITRYETVILGLFHYLYDAAMTKKNLYPYDRQVKVQRWNDVEQKWKDC